MSNIRTLDYVHLFPDDDQKQDVDRKNVERLYHNAFPEVQRSQLERRESGEALKCAMEVLDIFEPLAGLHPGAQVAFNAFKFFLQFELDRRQNEDRVIVVLEAQTDMMETLLRIKDGKYHEHMLNDGTSLRSKIESISIKIRDKIEACGNAVDCYYKESSLRRFAHAKDWKRRLGDFVRHFQDFKVDIMVALQIDQRVAATKASDKLDSILLKLDQSFERQSSFERALIMKFGKIKEEDLLDSNNTSLLKNIIEFAEARDESTGFGRLRKSDEGRESKEKTVKDVQAPLEILLRQNEITYEMKLQLKTDEVLGAIGSVGQQINEIATNIGGQHRSVNHEFRHIWKTMNWHYCVDLHAFITGLQEYYTDAFLFEDAEESVPDSPTIDHLDVENASSTDLLAPLSPADVIIHNEKREDDGEGLIQGGDSALTVFSLERSPNITLDQGAPGPKRILPLLEGPGDYHSIPPKYIAPSSIAATVSGSFKSRIDPKDAWTVTYINSQYTHEIIDAVDKDNSGFITQREANLFVSMKPDGFSLPEWIAYWAAGWPVETNIYRDKIMALYAKMLSIELQSKLILENRPYATFFLQSYSLGLVSGICESLNVRTTDDVKLKTLLNELMRRREHALEKRLKAIKFHIGDQGTLDLVCGKHRFETCLLPLLYLLLKHQYNAMLLCTEKVVDVCDLWEIGESYRIISDHIYSKTSDLYARTFGKERRNTLDFFDYYGNGIYKEYYMTAYNVHDSVLSLEDIRRQERDKEMGKDLPQGDSQHLGSDAESFLRRKCFDLDQYKAHVHDDMVDNFIKEFSSNETSPLDTFYDYINICYAEAPESISTVIENAEEQELQQTDHNNQTMSHDDWLATQRTARAAIYPYPHHSNINCDGCATSGLRTVRFKCLDCPDYDLCTDCISKELATLEKQSPDHTRTHNMIRLITPLPTWHTMIEMPKWRNIIGEFMLTNSGQADLKCSGICDTANFEGDIYKCIDCGSVTCAACDLPYDPNVPYVSPLQDSDVALPHMPAHKVIVIKDRDVDRYKREKSLGQETSKDMQDMVFDIKKRLTKMEANDGSISELKAELQRIGDENAALKRDFAELKNSMAIILQHILKGDAQVN